MSVRRAILITGPGVWAGVPVVMAQTARQRRIPILSNAMPPADMAGALGLARPRALLLRADEVIDRPRLRQRRTP